MSISRQLAATLRCVTVMEPYASALVLTQDPAHKDRAVKWIENRGWAPPFEIGERVGIHSGLGMKFLQLHQTRPEWWSVAGFPREWHPDGIRSGRELQPWPRGMVLGTVEYVGWFRRIKGDDPRADFNVTHLKALAEDLRSFAKHGFTDRQLLDHYHCEGPICWVFRDPQPFDEYVPAVGSQGVWKYQTGVLQAIRKAQGIRVRK